MKASRETETGEEGCLSIPGYIGEVERSVELVVRGQDAFGRPQRVKAHDYLARIFQHEIDHLDGVLFIDKADPATIHRLTAEEAAEAKGEAAEAAALMGVTARRAGEAHEKKPRFLRETRFLLWSARPRL